MIMGNLTQQPWFKPAAFVVAALIILWGWGLFVKGRGGE